MNKGLPPIQESVPYNDAADPFAREALEIAPPAGTVKDLERAGTG